MSTYYVDMYTDMDEPLTLEVDADSPEEAEAMAKAYVESAEAPCVGRIVVTCNAYLWYKFR